MYPLLLIAAAAVVAVLLWRRYRKPSGELLDGWELKGIIVLGKGTDGRPTVARCPRRLVAHGGHPITWEILDPQGTGAEVWLKEFKHEHSGLTKLFKGPDDKRKGKTRIDDELEDAPEAGVYTYSVYLDNELTADPEIEIKGGFI